jgi:hypothetical protein
MPKGVETKNSVVFTEEDFESLNEIGNLLSRIAKGLEFMRGEDEISSIMFDIGSLSKEASDCEDKFIDILSKYQD